jgi:hypothetical protein
MVTWPLRPPRKYGHWQTLKPGVCFLGLAIWGLAFGAFLSRCSLYDSSGEGLFAVSVCGAYSAYSVLGLLEMIAFAGAGACIFAVERRTACMEDLLLASQDRGLLIRARFRTALLRWSLLAVYALPIYCLFPLYPVVTGEPRLLGIDIPAMPNASISFLAIIQWEDGPQMMNVITASDVIASLLRLINDGSYMWLAITTSLYFAVTRGSLLVGLITSYVVVLVLGAFWTALGLLLCHLWQQGHISDIGLLLLLLAMVARYVLGFLVLGYVYRHAKNLLAKSL